MHPDYQWQWKVDPSTGVTLNNPKGISVVEYRRVGTQDWKQKTLAPKGTSAESFMDAGLVLRDDYLIGNVEPVYDINGIVIQNQILSKTKVGKYRVHRFNSVGNSIDTSSWWFTN